VHRCDKTGTLTTNQMAVVELILNGRTVGITRDFHVEGSTYSPSDGVIVGLQVGVLD
jgi:Ca2+-transporting ATPase